MDTLEADAAAVTAVRRGDAERYRELVDRHERRVFGVAWSRLGDAGLAEEATQEAFIRGYRRLWLLGDGAKFAGWISSIARNVAINLGLRHRRELNKRERWALEGTSTPGPSAEESDDPCTPETLRETLAELAPAHRECLVLFYLEDKSGTEAATALGISESAFRVRLHRARAALREQLEEKLAGSLERLRPAKTLVPAVMAAVLTSSTTKAAAAGTGATLVGALAKFSPLKWVFPFVSLISVLPALVFSWLYTRLELRNFRDPKGFRARIFREGMTRQILFVVLLMAVIWSMIPLIYSAYGLQKFYLLLAAFSIGTSVILGRRLAINRNSYFVMVVVSSAVLSVGCLAVGLTWMPVSMFNIVMIAHVILTSRAFGQRPVRMDYNFFLRSAEGMLPARPAKSFHVHEGGSLNKSQLLGFARFLGSRWLAVNYRWEKRGLALRLPSVKSPQWSMMTFNLSWSRCSQIILSKEGKVFAELAGKDSQQLQNLRGGELLNRATLESEVAAALESAWESFRMGDLPSAEHAIGQTPEKDIFLVPLAQSSTTRWHKWTAIVLVALTLPLLALVYFKSSGMGGLKPVRVTEPEIRAALAGFGKAGMGQNSLSNGLAHILFLGFVLPPTNLFTTEALQAIRQETFRYAGFDTKGPIESKFSSLARSWLLEKALAGGWFSLEELGVAPAQLSEYLRRGEPNSWKFSLSRRQVHGDGEDFTFEQFDGLTLAQLRLVREVNCLDLLDREKLIQQVRSLQVLSGTASPGRPPMRNWRDLRGLFITPGWPALPDTYCALAALEILGGLERIDRQACVKAILGLHRGKGFFAPSQKDAPWEPWKLQIRGDARDTFCAFESLRILGALDQVKDLEKWKFRPQLSSKAKSEPGQITWDEIEAWVCQQRLERHLRERKENSPAPVRSLAEL